MIAVVFPGQGAQQPGMGKQLCEDYPAADEVFQQVSEATGQDIKALCWESDEATLRETQNAQIALYTAGLAAHEALRARAPRLSPKAFAGHSVGEYAALAAAGVFSIETGAKLVKRRGELMAESGRKRPGAMAAVLGMDTEQLAMVLAESADAGKVVIANDNCPGQMVISGDVNAVQKASASATDKGARRVIPLNVSGAFHSPLMQESAEKMAEALREVTFETPEAPVYSNVLAAPGDDWTYLLEMQLRSPVRWTESVRQMMSDGIKKFAECGSGEVLTGLLKRIEKKGKSFPVVDGPTLEAAFKKLK